MWRHWRGLRLLAREERNNGLLRLVPPGWLAALFGEKRTEKNKAHHTPAAGCVGFLFLIWLSVRPTPSSDLFFCVIQAANEGTSSGFGVV